MLLKFEITIGTASNLFDALQQALAAIGLSLYCYSIYMCMSDTTNVMKRAWSGVQKLIKDQNPQLYDVGCICHFAYLTVKAGMKTLPVDFEQLFVDIFYYSHHSSKRK